MAFTEFFDVEPTGNYAGDEISSFFEPTIGNFSPGCMRLDVIDGGTNGSISATGTQAIGPNDSIYLNYRVINAQAVPPGNNLIKIDLTFLFAGGVTFTYDSPVEADTGWQQFSQSLGAWDGDFLQSVQIATPYPFPDGPGGWYAYVDSIVVDINPPPLAPTEQPVGRFYWGTGNLANSKPIQVS